MPNNYDYDAFVERTTPPPLSLSADWGYGFEMGSLWVALATMPVGQQLTASVYRFNVEYLAACCERLRLRLQWGVVDPFTGRVQFQATREGK